MACAYIQVIYSRLISQTKLTKFCSLHTPLRKAHSYKLYCLEAFSNPVRSATKALTYNRISVISAICKKLRIVIGNIHHTLVHTNCNLLPIYPIYTSTCNMINIHASVMKLCLTPLLQSCRPE